MKDEKDEDSSSLSGSAIPAVVDSVNSYTISFLFSIKPMMAFRQSVLSPVCLVKNIPTVGLLCFALIFLGHGNVTVTSCQ